MSVSIKIYVNHRYEEILTKEEYDAKVAEETAEFQKDSLALAEWLNDNYDEIDIWNMTPKQRVEAENDWAEYSKSRAKENLLDEGWYEYELTI